MLPTNEDALRQLATLGNDECQEGIFLVNERCVNISIVNGKVTWHIGYFRKMRSAKMYEVEQLLRLEKDSDLTWIHPNKPILM